ncbi:hypothetical protein AYI69_g2497 [Smittium culicis]|uniref:Uncharacterized protein n=1 Tax=Smittium culicis TaxID=133412 RepID=A0A1R1YMA4_9FUNG|nr:hypothetical protein AYI69_g2497 [Smittium culicis]
MVYGSQLLTPEIWDSNLPNNIILQGEAPDIDTYYNRLVEKKKKIHEAAKINEIRNKHYWKKSHYRKIRSRKFRIGDLVLKSASRKVHPMNPKNEGPLQFEGIVGADSYRIVEIRGRKDVVNAEKLKKYNIG